MIFHSFLTFVVLSSTITLMRNAPLSKFSLMRYALLKLFNIKDRAYANVKVDIEATFCRLSVQFYTKMLQSFMLETAFKYEINPLAWC